MVSSIDPAGSAGRHHRSYRSAMGYNEAPA
jgi:hypothetical protein